MAARKKKEEWIEVLTGSELDGPEESISDWAGLEVPESKSDQYVDLVCGVNPLQELFDQTKHGFFEVVDEEDDQGPGMNDTYWKVTTKDPEALRKEIRALLTKALGLEAPAPRKRRSVKR